MHKGCVCVCVLFNSLLSYLYHTHSIEYESLKHVLKNIERSLLRHTFFYLCVYVCLSMCGVYICIYVFICIWVNFCVYIYGIRLLPLPLSIFWGSVSPKLRAWQFFLVYLARFLSSDWSLASTSQGPGDPKLLQDKCFVQ